MSANGEENVVVDLISNGLAWAILRKFAHATPGAGRQLGLTGGRESFVGRDAACTVAEKLARCPAVERVLWLETAADCVRNVIRPQQARGGAVEVVGERAEVWEILFQYRIGLRHEGRRGDPVALMQREAQRLVGTTVYREQWALMICELSACWADDPAFRAWTGDET